MKIILLLFCTVIFVGCESKSPSITHIPTSQIQGSNVEKPFDEIKYGDLMEAVFRQMFRPAPDEKEISHDVNLVHKIYFISIDKQDPSAEFLNRFRNSKVPVKSISEGKWRDFFLFDKVTEERGAAFSIDEIRILNDNEAEVEAVIHPGGGFGASGSVYRLIRKDRKWKVTGEKLKWIS